MSYISDFTVHNLCTYIIGTNDSLSSSSQITQCHVKWKRVDMTLWYWTVLRKHKNSLAFHIIMAHYRVFAWPGHQWAWYWPGKSSNFLFSLLSLNNNHLYRFKERYKIQIHIYISSKQFHKSGIRYFQFRVPAFPRMAGLPRNKKLETGMNNWFHSTVFCSMHLHIHALGSYFQTDSFIYGKTRTMDGRTDGRSETNILLTTLLYKYYVD